MDMFPMLFNYSVIDSEHNRKLPYYWILNSQQEFALVGERKALDEEVSLYAVNDTLKDVRVDYTVTAYDEQLNDRVIATGSCKQKKNSAELINKIANGDKPELWIIKWNYQGKTAVNHTFVGRPSYEAAKEWVKIIGREMGRLDDFREIAWLEK